LTADSLLFSSLHSGEVCKCETILEEKENESKFDYTLEDS
jgi:hypothetical protein